MIAHQDRSASLEEARKRLAADGVAYLQQEVPVFDGALRGKIAPRDKALGASGTGLSTLIYSLMGSDSVALTPWSNVENGFPKLVVVPDAETAVRFPWRPGMGGVLHDTFMADGTPCPLDPRGLIRRLTAELAQRGFTAKVAYELEFYVFYADDALIEAGRHYELKPFGRVWDAYSINRFPDWQDLGREFIGRMADVGVAIDGFHTELGYGMFEFATSIDDPLRIADGASRARLYLKQLCAERGLVCTYMPKWRADRGDSGSGAHLHVSLWRDGQNLFWDPQAKQLSETARHALGGLLRTLPDLHVLFRPLVNSYRRFDTVAWNPTDASWGEDNHSVALRAITAPTPKHVHFEHRASGADASPYLSIAALLAGCLEGLDGKIDPGAPSRGDPILTDSKPRLPGSLGAAADALRASPIARRWLGDLFVDHYATTRAHELAEYEAWRQTQISAWELRRYFEWV